MKAYFRVFFVIFLPLLFFFNCANAQTKMNIQDTVQPREKFLVFSRTEIAAEFPGGRAAWKKYIDNVIEINLDSLTSEDYGTCIIKFIVHSNGDISKVEATTMEDSKLAKIAIAAIENGPKWIPARQNERNVNAYRLQPVTFGPVK